MSRLAGIWNLNGRPVEKDLLTRLSATLAHPGDDGDRQWIGGPVGLACRLNRVTPEAATESQPLADASGAVVVFDGRLDNREELLAALKPAPGLSSQAPDPLLVLTAYTAFGDQLPERLLGDFALALFDPTRQQLLLLRDALGMRPLYYHRTENRLVFASAIKAILAHPRVPRHPDSDSLGTLLLHGSAPDPGKTCFEGVSSLPPAHLAIVTPGRLLVRQYWDFDPEKQVRFRSFRECAEGFRHYFERAVRRRLRAAHRAACFVSGGLDSSSIFCLAQVLRHRDPEGVASVVGLSLISATGLTSRESDERAFLLEVERRYDVTIERIPFHTAEYANRCRRAVWHIEAPFLDTYWPGHDPYRFLDAAAKRGARVLLTGDWIEQMLGGQAYLVDLFRRRAWRAVCAHLSEFARFSNDIDPKWYWKRLVRDLVSYHAPARLLPFARRLQAGLGQALADCSWYTEAFLREARWRRATRPLGTRFASAHARCVYHYARSEYKTLFLETASKLASASALDVAFPFLDRELVSFLMGAPGELLTRGGVPKAILREAVTGIVPEAIVRRTWTTDSSDFVDEGLTEDLHQLTRVLDADSMAVRLGYVTEEGMRRARRKVAAQVSGGAIPASLRRLVAFELWLQLFFSKGFDESAERSARHAAAK